jgi:hypothetical protein
MMLRSLPILVALVLWVPPTQANEPILEAMKVCAAQIPKKHTL